jgi:hypothetical protein
MFSTPTGSESPELPSGCHPRSGVIPLRNKRLLVAIIVTFVLAAAVLPAFVAYRYTAPEQRGDFLRRPWRGWAFALAALTGPGSAQLKTSGMALRKAEWLFKGTAIDPQEVQLLFVPQDAPLTFSHSIGAREVVSTATPYYRFIWQVRGLVDTIPDSSRTIVALLDYETGRVLYDIRDDLLPSELAPEPSSRPTVGPSAVP